MPTIRESQGKAVPSEKGNARSAINTTQAVRRSVVDEKPMPYEHLGEMRQTMPDTSEISHVSDMHLLCQFVVTTPRSACVVLIALVSTFHVSDMRYL